MLPWWLALWYILYGFFCKTVSIEDILLKSPHTEALVEPPVQVYYRGVDVDWATIGAQVMSNATDAEHYRVRTTTETRHFRIYHYQGQRYAFVFAHPFDPGAIEPGQWHGSGFIKLI